MIKAERSISKMEQNKTFAKKDDLNKSIDKLSVDVLELRKLMEKTCECGKTIKQEDPEATKLLNAVVAFFNKIISKLKGE